MAIRMRAFSRAAVTMALLSAMATAASVAGEPARVDHPRRAADLVYEDINPNSPTHGQKLQLSRLWSDRGIVLNFIASWCHFCWTELPEFQALHAEHVAPFVGIAADEHDDPDVLIRMVAAADVTLPVLLVPSDEIAAVERHYDHGVLPATYVIDREGRIGALFQGMARRETLLEEIRMHLEP